MPPERRELPHFYLQNTGQSEPYTTRMRGRTPAAPIRNREEHARRLERLLGTALHLREEQLRAQVHGEVVAEGFYLQFQLPAGNEQFLKSLEDRRSHVELVSVKRGDEEASPLFATVFVPNRAANYLQRKLRAYAESAQQERARNESLINRIDSVSLANLQALFTDEDTLFPQDDNPVWWEVWLRGPGLRPQFQLAAQSLDIRTQPDEVIEFPEREVTLAFANATSLGRLLLRTDSVAELRIARDNPAQFIQMDNLEQREWSDAVANRIVAPGRDAVAITILDSGITHTHPLLLPAIQETDLHSYIGEWGTGDSAAWRGHGTAMGGIALYGDLTTAIVARGPITLPYRLESVKMLRPDGTQHDRKLYGRITRESVARVEIAAPLRPRAICMAVTSDVGVRRGRPSSWSAAVDKLAYGDETVRRLLLISVGNVNPGDIPAVNYLDRSDVEPVLNPAQAWNALGVGAYTEKTEIVDPTFAGWDPVAPSGELSPSSRTSLTWERQWPTKPDIVFEGGNYATDGTHVDSLDDLGLLTTHFRPLIQQFAILGDTSAATAGAARICGTVLASRPELWPETLRGIVVHSAEWTAAMAARFDAAENQPEKLRLLRRYGYGVPDIGRALLSARNDATLVVEDSLQPFWRDADGRIKTRDMHLHSLPWPRVELERLGEEEVSLRVTLSYFIEPNPGERGWTSRHRYASHGLRFALKRSLETVDEFRARINRAVEFEEEGLPQDTGEDNWLLGRIRNLGSIHSDKWIGSAAELARRDAIAIYPIGGWWKEKPNLERYDRRVRYALIVSIRTESTADIYTPIQVAIAARVPIET
jgi:Subtilase family